MEKKVSVDIGSQSLIVCINSDTDLPLIHGKLMKRVDQGSCYWYISDHVLHVSLLKHHRKGSQYAPGRDASDTWWPCLMEAGGPTIPREYAPSNYYLLQDDDDEDLPQRKLRFLQ